jgi:transcription antitermination factor NusG
VPRVRVSVTRKNGKVVFQNKKAMPGYLLVRCQFTPDVQHCIENTRGMHVSEWREFREDGSKGPLHISSKAFSVVKVLPFSEKVKFESIQKGEKIPLPSPLPQEAIDKFGQKPRKVTPLHLGVNDYVQIMHGPYATSKGTVKQVIDHHLENRVRGILSHHLHLPMNAVASYILQIATCQYQQLL